MLLWCIPDTSSSPLPSSCSLGPPLSFSSLKRRPIIHFCWKLKVEGCRGLSNTFWNRNIIQCSQTTERINLRHDWCHSCPNLKRIWIIVIINICRSYSKRETKAFQYKSRLGLHQGERWKGDYHGSFLFQHQTSNWFQSL